MHRKFLKIFKIFSLVSLTILTSCQTHQAKQDVPKIVPAVEIKRDVKHPLGIIGEVEPVYIPPMKSPFLSRIDTGATTSSIDIYDEKVFERDGKKWVSFSIVNWETGEKHKFEKRLQEIKKIKRINGSEERHYVIMDVRIGNQTVKERFSLAKRERFNYQVLIGRNVLTGRAIVDTSLKNTLK